MIYMKIKYKGKNAYLTGDLGYLKGGNLYYKCRKDKQIKLHGYRIELGEIDSIMNGEPLLQDECDMPDELSAEMRKHLICRDHDTTFIKTFWYWVFTF